MREVEALVTRAEALDKGARSWQWMEAEFFVPTTHRAWDPGMREVYRHRGSHGAAGRAHEDQAKDLAMVAYYSPGKKRSPQRKQVGSGNPLPLSSSSEGCAGGAAASPPPLTKTHGTLIDRNIELCAKCSCNFAQFLQYVRHEIGNANVWLTQALADAPGDPMVNGCYHDFFDRGLAFTLTDQETNMQDQLQLRLLGRRETRKERETRLARLERERVRRITVQEMEKERSVRQAAFDRISENLRREEMLKHDWRLLGRLQNIANQRRSILGSIGKSQAEIAKERKAARAAAKQRKKAKRKKGK